jgi:hypothetical protein
MNTQYWVIGGEFRCLEFRELDGSADALGPFKTYEEAERVWRDRAEATRGEARTRYTIVTTAQNPRRLRAAA